jgi:hypothetical protein
VSVTLRLGLVLAVFPVLSGCGGGDAHGKFGYYIDAKEPELRANLAALAACPSPLTRLGIAHRPLNVTADQAGEVVIAIPSKGDAAGSTVRFKIGFEDKKPDARLNLTWSITLADNADELDLGEGRLLNPPKLVKELDEAVSRYATYFFELGHDASSARRFEASRDIACRSFGRLADGLAIVTNPDLRKTLERQKRRDALGWLFKDNYQLKTDSPEGAYWEGEGDYTGGDYRY